VTLDAQARHDAKAPIGVATCPDDVPGRERAVGVAHREARHVGAAESIGDSALCPDPPSLFLQRGRVDGARKRKITVRAVIRRGSPSAEIVQLASEEHADLVIMGTHGRGGIERITKSRTAPRDYVFGWP
jgi:nucleotide-binding universal stress UspA family protein